MEIRDSFTAPWGRSVWILTALTTLIVSTVVVFLIGAGQAHPRDWGVFYFTGSVLVLLMAGTACFAVRGYRLGPNELIVLRPGWESRVALTGLTSVTLDSHVFTGIMVKLGSSGFLGFFGWFWNRRLGWFRAWATDPKRAVCLRFPDRLVVVSPDDPVAFKEALERNRGTRPVLSSTIL